MLVYLERVRIDTGRVWYLRVVKNISLCDQSVVHANVIMAVKGGPKASTFPFLTKIPWPN